MDKIFLNNSAELRLDAPERITHIFINVPEPTTLTDICIDKGDGWMPYNGSVQINGTGVQFPATLYAGDNFIKLLEPFEGVGVYLKGYDFLNTLDIKVVRSTQGVISGGDNSRSGELIVATPGIITINFNDITTTNYNVVALITTTDGSIGIANVLFNTRTNTSVQVHAYEPGIMRYVITPNK